MGIYKSYKRRFHLKNARLKKYQKNKQSNEDVPTNINEKAPNSIDEKDSFGINEETAVKAPNQSLQRMQQRKFHSKKFNYKNLDLKLLRIFLIN